MVVVFEATGDAAMVVVSKGRPKYLIGSPSLEDSLSDHQREKKVLPPDSIQPIDREMELPSKLKLEWLKTK
ncbi:hypothetical protein ACOSQ3_023527 [Xanthoceras sorbifolium]